MDKRYKSEIDVRSSHYPTDYISHTVFNDESDLHDVDRIMQKKAKRIYEKRPLDFSYREKTLVKSRIDCIGEGKAEEWVRRYDVNVDLVFHH